MAIKPLEIRAIPTLQVVELTTALPEHGLRAGQRGTVVEVYNRGEAYEVEFIDKEGYTTALLTLKAHQIRQPKRVATNNGAHASG